MSKPPNPVSSLPHSDSPPAALHYVSWTADTWQPPFRAVAILVTPVLLTVAAMVIAVLAGNDADPFAPTSTQASLYLGATSVVILAWAGWAAALCVALVRRKLKSRWALLLVVGLPWGGFLCCALYQIAAEYIDQTSRFHGENWPLLKHIFR